MLLGLLIILFQHNVFTQNEAIGDQHYVTGSPNNKQLPDICYNSSTSQYLVVWEEYRNATWAIAGATFNSNWVKINEFTIVESTEWDYRNPKVAFASSDKWVVVFEVSQTVTSQTKIGAARIGPNGVEYYFLIKENIYYTLQKPDIGGSWVNDEYLIVWQEENIFGYDEIRGCRFSAYYGVQGNEMTLADSDVDWYNKTSPSVTQRGSNYFVVWEKNYNASRIDIQGIYVTYYGSTGNLFDVRLNSGNNGSPNVASGGTAGDYLVVWHYQYNGNDYDIYYAFVSESSVLYIGALSWTNQIEFKPCVSYIGSLNKFVISYGKALGWAEDWNIYAKMLTRYFSIGAEEPVSETGANEGSPATTLVGESCNRAIIVWDRGDNNLYACDWCENPPCPVELTCFEIASVKNNVQLNWSTATEVGNFGFEIERCVLNSFMKQWEKIGFIKCAGNSNSPKNYSFTDNHPSGGSKFAYRLKQTDNDGAFEYSKEVEIELTPETFSLSQSYPNPFNPSTTIEYQLPNSAQVTLSVYNSLGQLVNTLVNEEKDAGYYQAVWNGNDNHGNQVASGIYFYRLQTGNFINTKKMILLR